MFLLNVLLYEVSCFATSVNECSQMLPEAPRHSPAVRAACCPCALSSGPLGRTMLRTLAPWQGLLRWVCNCCIPPERSLHSQDGLAAASVQTVCPNTPQYSRQSRRTPGGRSLLFATQHATLRSPEWMLPLRCGTHDGTHYWTVCAASSCSHMGCCHPHPTLERHTPSHARLNPFSPPSIAMLTSLAAGLGFIRK